MTTQQFDEIVILGKLRSMMALMNDFGIWSTDQEVNEKYFAARRNIEDAYSRQWDVTTQFIEKPEDKP